MQILREAESEGMLATCRKLAAARVNGFQIGAFKRIYQKWEF